MNIKPVMRSPKHGPRPLLARLFGQQHPAGIDCSILPDMANMRKSRIRQQLLFLAMSFLIVSTYAAAQLSPIVKFKQYPWDTRPRKCFISDKIPDVMQCHAQPDWPDSVETSRRLFQLFDGNDNPDFDLIERAQNDIGFTHDRFPTGEFFADKWYDVLGHVAVRVVLDNTCIGSD